MIFFQAVRVRTASGSPPLQRRSSGTGGMGAVKHGTIEPLEGYDIYSAIGLVSAETKLFI